MCMAIIIDPEILRGKPIIAGTRISVELILELLASGMSVEEILLEYQTLSKKNVLEVLDYARKSLKHEEVIHFKAG